MKNKLLKTGTVIVLMLLLLATVAGCSSAASGQDSTVAVIEADDMTHESESEYATFVPEASATPPASTVPEETLENSPQAPLRACSISTDELETFQYWLYTPENSAEKLPLIVYLHGASGKGEDLELLTSAEDFPKYLLDGTLGDINAYVLMPQLPSSQKGWSSITGSLYSLIQETISEYSIDENNISLVGFSMGGTGVWNLAAAYPTLFARIAPMAGSARAVLQQVSVLKSIPVWTFVGADDTVISPNSSKEMVYALKKAGGTADITLFEGADHISVPPLAWLDDTINLMAWLTGAAG